MYASETGEVVVQEYLLAAKFCVAQMNSIIIPLIMFENESFNALSLYQLGNGFYLGTENQNDF